MLSGGDFGCCRAAVLLNPLFAVSQRQTALLVGSRYARSKTQDANPRQQHSENKAIREEMKKKKTHTA